MTRRSDEGREKGMKCIIRPEERRDYTAVEAVLRSAFGRSGKEEGFNEWRLVENIRFEPAYRHGIKFEDSSAREYLLVLELHAGSLDCVQGVVRYCDPFYNERGELL